MRTGPDLPGGTPDSAAGGPGGPADGAEDRPPRRVILDPEGPVLIEGPVEVDLPDGRTARSDRFLVAVCTCRRSRRFPWCDTSHRRKERRPRTPGTDGD